jgi:hypothetical protein
MSDSSLLLEPSASPSRRRHLLFLVLLLAVGLLVYELTTQPVLAVAVVALKFGWTDLNLGWQLWRVDFDRSRARAFFWLYLGAALADVLFGGLMMGLVVAIASLGLHAFIGGRPAGVTAALLLALAITLAGLLFSALASSHGFNLARRHGIKVWLELFALQEQKRWPYLRLVHGVNNKARYLLGSALMTGWLLSFLGSMALLALGGRAAGGWILLPTVILLAGFCVAVVGGFGWYPFLERRFLANNPEQCWGTDVIGAIMTLSTSQAQKARLLAAIPREFWQSEELAGTVAPTA